MEQTKEYLIVVTPLSEEDGGGFLARVPDLPGCFGDGATRESAVKDAGKAIIEWVDEYEKMGREIPSPGSLAAEVRKHREGEIKLITELRDSLRAKERDFDDLDARLSAIERDVEHLLETVDNDAAWERFHVIMKTTRSGQKEMFPC